MIGERLKEIRKDHHDTQADLAEKLNVSIYTIQSWEQEKSEPNHKILVAICNLYHISSDYLLGLTDSDTIFHKSGTFTVLPLASDDQEIINILTNHLIKKSRENKK